MAGCHSAPGSPGTWTASPRCVLPPTGGQGRFSHPSGPVSPPQFAGYADSTGRRQRSHRPVGLSYPLSKHRFCTPSGRATTMFSKVGLKSFVSWTLAPANSRLYRSSAQALGVGSYRAPPTHQEQSADWSTPPYPYVHQEGSSMMGGEIAEALLHDDAGMTGWVFANSHTAPRLRNIPNGGRAPERAG